MSITSVPPVVELLWNVMLEARSPEMVWFALSPFKVLETALIVAPTPDKFPVTRLPENAPCEPRLSTPPVVTEMLPLTRHLSNKRSPTEVPPVPTLPVMQIVFSSSESLIVTLCVPKTVKFGRLKGSACAGMAKISATPTRLAAHIRRAERDGRRTRSSRITRLMSGLGSWPSAIAWPKLSRSNHLYFQRLSRSPCNSFHIFGRYVPSENLIQPTVLTVPMWSARAFNNGRAIH